MALRKRNYDRFRDALLDRGHPGGGERPTAPPPERESRAIAGLSMGGAESLYVGPQRPRPLRVRRRLQLRRPARRPRHRPSPASTPRRTTRLRLLWIALRHRGRAHRGQPQAPRLAGRQGRAAHLRRDAGRAHLDGVAPLPGRPWRRCSSSGGARPAQHQAAPPTAVPASRVAVVVRLVERVRAAPSPPPSMVIAGMPRLDRACSRRCSTRVGRRVEAERARRGRAPRGRCAASSGCAPAGRMPIVSISHRQPHRATAASARSRRRAPLERARGSAASSAASASGDSERRSTSIDRRRRDGVHRRAALDDADVERGLRLVGHLQIGRSCAMARPSAWMGFGMPKAP